MSSSHSQPVLASNGQPEVEPSVATILRKAADLIAAPGAWTQGAFGRDAAGMVRPIQFDSAECFCALGAIAKVTHHDPDSAWTAGIHVDAREWAERALGGAFLVDWNDKEGRTQVEVVAALRKAADLADADTSERLPSPREDLNPPATLTQAEGK